KASGQRITGKRRRESCVRKRNTPLLCNFITEHPFFFCFRKHCQRYDPQFRRTIKGYCTLFFCQCLWPFEARKKVYKLTNLFTRLLPCGTREGSLYYLL